MCVPKHKKNIVCENRPVCIFNGLACANCYYFGGPCYNCVHDGLKPTCIINWKQYQEIATDEYSTMSYEDFCDEVEETKNRKPELFL